jgi:two-component system NarL family sensor kinase
LSVAERPEKSFTGKPVYQALRAEALSEIAHLLRETLREIRTTSYLLHPPLLDELGLAPAVRWFAEGFTKRSNIKVDLELSAELPRLSPEMETAIFRIIQECLTNIHRHSGSETAKIRLVHCPPQVRFEIEDQGHGIGADKLAEFRTQTSTGVGMRGMRERIRQLGGTMEVRSNEGGTAVLAIFPLAGDGDRNSFMQ